MNHHISFSLSRDKFLNLLYAIGSHIRQSELARIGFFGVPCVIQEAFKQYQSVFLYQEDEEVCGVE